MDSLIEGGNLGADFLIGFGGPGVFLGAGGAGSVVLGIVVYGTTCLDYYY